MMIARATSACFLLLLAAAVPHRQETKPAPQETDDSCRAFVQDFYNWYSAKAMAETDVSAAMSIALKERDAAFSPELLDALRQESAAIKKDGGEDWIDFDVFLNSQDIAERYVMGNVTRHDKAYLVEVYGIWSGRKSVRPDVVPELEFKHGQWVFVNFHYGDRKGQDLVNVLKSVREDRQAHAH